MIKGLGTDIIEIKRIEKVFKRYGDKFLEKILTKREIAYVLKHKYAATPLAGRFAAKEAVSKAFGFGIQSDISWKDIEILNDPLGRPDVLLSPKLRDRFQNPTILLSVSHSRDYAIATAIWS